MGFLTRKIIVQAQDLPFENVDVPEWGGTVRVIGLNAKDAQRFINKLVTIGRDGKVENINTESIMTDLLCASLVDENNQRLFSDEQVEELANKSAEVVRRLFEISQRLSGIGDQAQTDILKNSKGTPEDVLLTS